MTKQPFERLLGHLRDTMARATRALRGIGAGHAVIGAVALGKVGAPRFTEDIDFLVDPALWREASLALRAAGFVPNPEGPAPSELLARFIDRRTGAGVDLLFGVGDPEESAREAAVKTTVFGTSVPVASAEFLLWMYLLSDEPRHEADGIELLVRRLADPTLLRRWLRHDGSERGLWPRLAQWIARADVVRRSRARRGRP